MAKEPRVGFIGLKVLQAFFEAGARELSGAELHKQYGFQTGTLYPLLLKFESVGWLESRWEDVEPSEVGRPRRRYYKITPEGISKLTALHRELAGKEGKWKPSLA